MSVALFDGPSEAGELREKISLTDGVERSSEMFAEARPKWKTC